MARKNSAAKKSTASKAPRRSSSQFTPIEAVAVRGSRPTAITYNEKRDVYIVTLDGKKKGEAHSISGARRLRARIERDAYVLTPAKKAAAVKKYQKSREQ